MNGSIGIICITKHGIEIARRLKSFLPTAQIFAQSKHSDSQGDVTWFDDSASSLVSKVFKTHEALICIFSLGAVIRLISPLLSDKKKDPAVLVIDDKANFVISALSGHLGGANALSRKVADLLNAKAVITTAADVNETIAVDLLGREFNWTIENFENVTKVSAFVVNEERVGIFQDSGEKDWWKGSKLPANITPVGTMEDLRTPEFKACLIISDQLVPYVELLEKSVIYRPKSLVVGVGFHRDTSAEDIRKGMEEVFKEKGLAFDSVRNISSLNKNDPDGGLKKFSEMFKIPLELYDKTLLAKVTVPNPSQVVKKFEGIPSVSEAAAILSSGGDLIIPKHKFPPNLTLAVAKINFG
jgi:cobalt-precorrin 5A hydrolase